LPYGRDAADPLIGIVGSQGEAEQVMAQVKACIQKHLNREIAAEQSRISHATQGTIFLGDEARTGSSGQRVRARRRGRVTLCSTVNDMVRRRIPAEQLRTVCPKNGDGHYATLHTVPRPA